MPNAKAAPILLNGWCATASVLLSGCTGSPDLLIAGAYFPAWLVCSVIGALCALLLHGALLVSPFNNKIPMQLGICACAGVIFGAIIWMAWIGI